MLQKIKFSNFVLLVGYAAPAGQGQIQWMQAPPAPENCPPGLEYLTQVDQLLIKQQVELLEGRSTCIFELTIYRDFYSM